MCRFIGLADVERGTVGIGIDSDGTEAHFAKGADNAESDLAAVRDLNLTGERHVFETGVWA